MAHTIALTPLDPTGKSYSRTIIGSPGSGRSRRELWQAYSAGRTWRYRREDSPGTPWALDRWNPDAGRYVEVYSGFGSLRQARAATANPTWVADLRERCLAESA